MFISDTTTIETLTAAYTDDALRAGINQTIQRTRRTRDEHHQWRTAAVEYATKAGARMETIETIDRTLATDIRGAFHTIEEEAWKEAGAHFGIEGNRHDIITALGQDFADIFDVIFDGLEDKVRAQVEQIAARRAAEQEATR